MPKGVKIEDLRVGDGALAGRRTTVTLRYDGLLRRGDRFQSTTCTFDMSRRNVIAGLRYGVEGMRVGGLRRLTISPYLAYRGAGVPGLIPPNAVLVFEVELLDVRPSEGSQNTTSAG